MMPSVFWSLRAYWACHDSGLPEATFGFHRGPKLNKVIRPKSRATALSEKSGRQTDKQTKTSKETFEVASKSL